jgi:hypothetical protein
MKCYEFFENYYRCVYVVADLYDYTSKFMEIEARKDLDLLEAQAHCLVFFKIYLRSRFKVDFKIR